MPEENKENLDVTNERLWSLLCYVPVIGVFVCLVASVRMVASPLCRFHCRQGLVVFGFFMCTLLLGVLHGLLAILLNLAALAASFYGMYLAFNARREKIVLLGDLAMKIGEFDLYRKLTGNEPDKNLLK